MRGEATRGGYEWGTWRLREDINFLGGGTVGVEAAEFVIWTRYSFPVG
jgi:hypothetical protein